MLPHGRLRLVIGGLEGFLLPGSIEPLTPNPDVIFPAPLLAPEAPRWYLEYMPYLTFTHVAYCQSEAIMRSVGSVGEENSVSR